MTYVFLGLTVILIVAVVKASLARPNALLKLIIHTLGGIVGLWLIDLLLSIVGFAIPINPFTIVLVGFLGFPGVLLLGVLQMLGI